MEPGDKHAATRSTTMIQLDEPGSLVLGTSPSDRAGGHWLSLAGSHPLVHYSFPTEFLLSYYLVHLALFLSTFPSLQLFGLITLVLKTSRCWG